jgi:putative DNA primase/helicase
MGEVNSADNSRTITAFSREKLAANIPLELRELTRWLVWRLEDVDDEGGKRRERSKVPYQSKDTTKRAKSNDARTWSTFDEACQAVDSLVVADKYKDEPHPRGVGLAIYAPYFAVDLDKCVDDNCVIADWAKEFIAKCPATYAELSPSRHGLHLWYASREGWTKLDGGKRHGLCEVYKQDRYFTMTGDVASIGARDDAE